MTITERGTLNAVPLNAGALNAPFDQTVGVTAATAMATAVTPAVASAVSLAVPRVGGSPTEEIGYGGGKVFCAGEFLFMTKSTTETKSASQVAAIDTNRHVYRIVKTGTSVYFYYDDMLTAIEEHTTNIASSTLGLIFQIVPREAVAKNIDPDACFGAVGKLQR